MNTARFFLSQVDGHLYRDGNMSSPFRAGLVKWNPKIRTVAELKATIRAADHAFGGTSLVLFTDDGAALCGKCARTEFRQIAEAVRDKDRSGWRVIAASMDSELEACECEHCGAVIVEEHEEDGLSDERDPDDDFVDSDPWRGGPEGDMFG